MNILVTGASGFVGSALVKKLSTLPNYYIIAASRKQIRIGSEAVRTVVAPDLGPDSNWRVALRGVDTVIHTAARVHRIKEATNNQIAAYRYANTQGTFNLARQAVEMGVRQFIFLSSIKVNGAETQGEAYKSTDTPSPMEPYAISKWEAEQALTELSERTGLECIIVRPPLVYGPGVKANYAMLLRALWERWPLPLGAATNNRRSLVSMENLVDLLATCLKNPCANNRTFLVSDGEDLSTFDILKRQGHALGRPPRLMNISPSVIRFGLRLLRRKVTYDRLFGSLQVDIDETCKILNWSPPFTVEQGMGLMAESYRMQVEMSGRNV